MKNLVKNFIVKHSKLLCSLMVVSAYASLTSCRFLYFQPEVPEGLDKIVKYIRIQKHEGVPIAVEE